MQREILLQNQGIRSKLETEKETTIRMLMESAHETDCARKAAQGMIAKDVWLTVNKRITIKTSPKVTAKDGRYLTLHSSSTNNRMRKLNSLQKGSFLKTDRVWKWTQSWTNQLRHRYKIRPRKTRRKSATSKMLYRFPTRAARINSWKKSSQAYLTTVEMPIVNLLVTSS